MTKGVKSSTVNPQGYATITFDENAISAQQVANAISGTAHMMGKGMQYGGVLVLSVRGVNEGPTATKATLALSQVEGVAKVRLYPKQQAVGIQFTGKGKATSKELLDALSAAGLKGTPYTTTRGASGRSMNGGNGPMPDHAGMAMGNSGMNGNGPGVSQATGGYAPCMPSPGTAFPYYAAPGRGYIGFGGWTGGGCGCCR